MLLVLTTNTVFSIATIMMGGKMAMLNDLRQDIDIMSCRVLHATELLLHKLFHALFLELLTLANPVDPCQHTQLVPNIVIDGYQVFYVLCT